LPNCSNCGAELPKEEEAGFCASCGAPFRSMLVSIEDLAKSFGKVVAVDGLSLNVEKGSIMGLIGPNGAGKTTTIKVLLGLLRPDRGKVEAFGEDPWDNPKIRSRIGVIYERANFPSHHRVLDYLEKVCRIFGFPESRGREMLETVGLNEAYERPIRGLSAGMLQKFAIAHALINKPELVVADEPTSNLDPQARNDILDLILKIHHDEKATFLISSHILPELSRVCESVAIINKGKVWAQGSFSELRERFGVGTTRISTDKPVALAQIVKDRLGYVKRVEIDDRGISVDIARGSSQQLYADIPMLARKVDANILGIESGTASLEELFKMAVGAGKKEGA
jgi:ABC-type multidrug transport system ATPase subunit